MDSRAANLDGDDGVEGADGGLEGLEVAVLVREDTEVARVDAQTDSGVDVLLGRLEPGVTLRLQGGVDQYRTRSGVEEVPTCLKMWWRKAS